MKAEERASVKFKVKLLEKDITTTIVRLEPWLEPCEKKQRVFFSYDDDERISLAVIASLDKFILPVLGSSWFQSNLIETGIVNGHTGQGLHQRWTSKLQGILSDALDETNRNDVASKEKLKVCMLERLKVIHGLIELIQVELTPVVLEF